MRMLAALPIFALLAAATSHADPQRIQTAKDLFAKLVGEWTATGTFTTDVSQGKVQQVAYTWTCKQTAGGNALACVMASSDPKMEEQQVLAYDAGSDRIHVFTANSWGEAYDHSGSLAAGATAIEAKADTTKNGKSFVETYTWTFVKPNELQFVANDVVGRAPGPHGEFTLKKK